jgi:hypothetical protein
MNLVESVTRVEKERKNPTQPPSSMRTLEAKTVGQIPVKGPTMTDESTAVTRESPGMQPSPGLGERRYPHPVTVQRIPIRKDPHVSCRERRNFHGILQT